jgi:hypothetical protein
MHVTTYLNSKQIVVYRTITLSYFFLNRRLIKQLIKNKSYFVLKGVSYI